MEVRLLLMTCLVTLSEMLLTSSAGVEYYGTSPLNAYDVSGQVDQVATLRCQLQTGRHNRGWFMITWQRMEGDGTVLPLIHLPVRHKIPEWSKEIPPSVQRRVQPLITVQPGHVEFNLQFVNLTCSDEAEYRCTAITPQGEIISAAELSIYANPQKPRIIHKRKVTSRRRGEITVECKADVGLPPRMLVWYSKTQGDSYFTILDKQRDIIQETDGCSIVSIRKVDIYLREGGRATRYRCGYPGYIQKEGMFDEVVLGSSMAEMGEVGVEPEVAAVCQDQGCDRNNMDVPDSVVVYPPDPHAEGENSVGRVCVCLYLGVVCSVIAGWWGM